VAAENRISTCESDIDSLESEVNSLDGRVSNTESDISDAEVRISACEADIDRIDAELVDKTGEINNLANRMTIAEADIDDIDARLDGIETGNILLSQLVPDADKDMGGKALTNVKILTSDLIGVDTRTINTPPNEYNSKNFAPRIWSEFKLASAIELSPASSQFGTLITISDYASGSASRHQIFFNRSNIYKRYAVHNDPKWPYPWRKIVTSDLNDIVNFNGIVITDGGTVDGVDISTHTHDGTTVGGPKISYNDLVDKPQVDVANHTHDGSTIGGPKISYNDLVDKPTIPTKLSQLATDVNNQRVSAAEKAEWNRISTHTHDGTTDGGPKISYNDLVDKPTIQTVPPAFKGYKNTNFDSYKTEYLKLSTGRSGFIPMRVYVKKTTEAGEIRIYAIFDDSSELQLVYNNSPMGSSTRNAHEIAQLLGNNNKSGRTITEFKIQETAGGKGEAIIDAYEF